VDLLSVRRKLLGAVYRDDSAGNAGGMEGGSGGRFSAGYQPAYAASLGFGGPGTSSVASDYQPAYIASFGAYGVNESDVVAPSQVATSAPSQTTAKSFFDTASGILSTAASFMTLANPAASAMAHTASALNIGKSAASFDFSGFTSGTAQYGSPNSLSFSNVGGSSLGGGSGLSLGITQNASKDSQVFGSSDSASQLPDNVSDTVAVDETQVASGGEKVTTIIQKEPLSWPTILGAVAAAIAIWKGI